MYILSDTIYTSDPSRVVPAIAVLLLSKWHMTRQECHLKYITKSSLPSFEMNYCVEWEWSLSGNAAKSPGRIERIQSVYESEASITVSMRKIKRTFLINPYYQDHFMKNSDSFGSEINNSCSQNVTNLLYRKKTLSRTSNKSFSLLELLIHSESNTFYGWSDDNF